MQATIHNLFLFEPWRFVLYYLSIVTLRKTYPLQSEVLGLVFFLSWCAENLSLTI